MKQRFEIIAYKDGFVALDKPSKIPQGKYYLIGGIIYFGDGFEYCISFKVLFATSNLNLSGVPILPMPMDESESNIPKAVWIEMESPSSSFSAHARRFLTGEIKPKLTPNNEIIVINFEY